VHSVMKNKEEHRKILRLSAFIVIRYNGGVC
jgi:hypothetical protein